MAHVPTAPRPPRVYLRGRVWWADVHLPDGSRRRFSTGKTDRALALAEAVAASGPQVPQETTLGHLLEILWAERWSVSRAHVQLKYTVPLTRAEVGHWVAAEVTYRDLNEYAQGRLRAGLAPATVNRRLSIISTALREGHRRGMCPAPPLFPHLKEPPGRDRYVTQDEERAILAEFARRSRDAEAHRRQEWEYMGHLVTALLDTGARLSELLRAQPDQLRGDMLFIPDIVTKTQRGRVLPLTPRALTAIATMVEHPCHRVASIDWAGHRFTVVVHRTLKLRDVVLHVLRHTCAARLLAAGVEIYTVSKWLGHSSVKVTERYAKLQTGMLVGAREALMRNL